jgi:hypothetical protein
MKAQYLEGIKQDYNFKCVNQGYKPQKPELMQEELSLSKLIPVRMEAHEGIF